MPSKPRVIIITGPTAVGKTGVGLDVALALDGEVISADSVQVYRGLDIGSDKLPVSERKGVPHHLIDVLEVHEDYSAGRFHDDAHAAIRDVLSRGRTPVVVGGTGFYLRFLQEGKPQADKTTPEVASAVKEEIQKVWQDEATKLGIEGGADGLSLAQKWGTAVRLLGVWGDADAMHKISQETNNYYRLERALAVLRLTGRKRAEVDIGAQLAIDSGNDMARTSSGRAASTSKPGQELDFRLFFLHRDREVLYRRCNARVTDMVLGLGLLDEAAMLLGKGISSCDGAAPGSMAGKAVGYRQAIEWILQVADAEVISREDIVALVDAICFNTHKLVRHQMTWFRDNSSYKWIDMDQLDEAAATGSSQLTATDAAVAMILDHARRPEHEGECPADSGRLEMAQAKRLKTMHGGGPFHAVVAAASANVAAVSKHQKQQHKQQQRQLNASQGAPSLGDAQGRRPDAGIAPDEGLQVSAAKVDSAVQYSNSSGQQVLESFMGRTAEQLLAEVDLAAAHVSQVLLPQLRKNACFQELLASARAERETALVQQAAKAKRRLQERKQKAADRAAARQHAQ